MELGSIHRTEPNLYFPQKNLRRASITIDAILKLNPTLSSSGPVVQVDSSDNVEEQKVKAKKNRRKSLSDMCKVGLSVGGLPRGPIGC